MHHSYKLFEIRFLGKLYFKPYSMAYGVKQRKPYSFKINKLNPRVLKCNKLNVRFKKKQKITP